MQRNQFSNQPLNSPYSQSNHVAVPEYSGTPSHNRIKPGVGARVLISAGMLVLTVWTVSIFSDGGNAYSDTSPPRSAASPVAMLSLPPTHNEDEPLDLPPLDSKVKCSAMGMYHWQRDCPLDGGISIRRSSQVANSHRKEQRITRRDAELQNYYPCLYCAEIEDWRAQKNTGKK